MISIHRVILPRLLLVWVFLSLVGGGLTYTLEIRKIDKAVVTLAAAEASHFAAAAVGDDQRTPAQVAALASQAREFVMRNFVAVDVFDRDGRLVAAAVKPGFEAITAAVKARARPLPRDDRPHYKTVRLGGETVVRVIAPLPSQAGGNGGFFEGLFIVAPQTLAALHADLWRTLLAVLAAVLATTIVLYPVIVALNRGVLRASREILKGNLEMASVLGAAIAKRDSDTNIHNYRVTLYACSLGAAVGVRGEAMRALMLGAFLHDVGKIGIGDAILLKPAQLTPEEFATMRTHVALGVDIIASSSWLHAARDVVQYHHEWYDGSGYLKGLKGEAIPLNARIFAVVDVFDALTSHRPYKEPWTCEAALAWLDQGAGSHFDPRLVAAFHPIARELHPRLMHADEAEITAQLAERIESHLLPSGAGRGLRFRLLRRRAAAGAA